MGKGDPRLDIEIRAVFLEIGANILFGDLERGIGKTARDVVDFLYQAPLDDVIVLIEAQGLRLARQGFFAHQLGDDLVELVARQAGQLTFGNLLVEGLGAVLDEVQQGIAVDHDLPRVCALVLVGDDIVQREQTDRQDQEMQQRISKDGFQHIKPLN